MAKNTIKTLVVDDSALFRESIKSFLEAQSEIDLIGLVDSGEQCLKFINEYVLDLVMMDVRMSGLDGIVTTQRLKKKYPHIKIIICTVWAEKEARAYATRAGADDYFVKGEPLSALLKKIKSLFPSYNQLHIFP